MAFKRTGDERSSKKRQMAKEIVAKLRQLGVLTAQSGSVTEAIRSIGMTESSKAK